MSDRHNSPQHVAPYAAHVRRLVNAASRASSWREAAPLLDQAANLARAAAAIEDEEPPRGRAA